MRLLPLALALLAVPPHMKVMAAGEIAAGRGYPEQVAVVTVGAIPEQRGRVAVWDRGRRGWYRVFSVPARWVDNARITEGDVTGDGHREFLVTLSNGGSADSGPRRVLGIVNGRTRQLYARYVSDTDVRIRGGSLVVDAGDYRSYDSHCCPTFEDRTVYRWSRGELRPAARALYWNGMYGIRDWGRRRIGRFTPRIVAHWGHGIGIAVGGRLPWLVARTRDAGKTWRIVEATAFPLGRPRIVSPRGARVPVRRCQGGRCRTIATISTRDRGLAWSFRGVLAYLAARESG